MNLDYLKETFKFLETGSDWIVQVFLILVAILLFNFFQRRVLRRLQRRLEKTKTAWDDALVASIGAPLYSLIWIIGIAFAAHIVQESSGAEIFSAFVPARDVGVISCLVWFLVRFVNRAEQNILSQREAVGKPLDKTTADAVSKLIRVAVIITGVLVALQTLGFSVSGVMAFGGIGGIAIGFAAKDLLANFFGGLMIYLDRPFAVGDWVRSPEKEIEGTVENIGWRLTRIRTFDKRPLYVPNAVFANITVENPSRMTHRRIYETIGIRYEDANKLETIIKDIKSMLLSHDEIDSTQTMIVNFNAYGPSSLDFFVYTFTKTTNWIHFHEVKQDVLLKIYNIIVSHNADIAFPTTTINTSEQFPFEIKTPENHPLNLSKA